MSHEVWTQRLSRNLSREIRWRLVAPLTFGLLIVAGMRESGAASLQFVYAQAQDQNLIAMRKIEEGEALHAQGTLESMRLAATKYEEALLLCRGIGNRSGEAIALNNLGLVYNSMDE